MKVFYDVFSNDELFSDSYKPTPMFDGVGYEVQSKLVVKGVGDIDIGRGSQFGGTDEDDQGVEDKAEKVNDIVDGFKYTETVFNKSDYTTYIRAYLKKLKTHLEEKNPDRVAGFMAGAKEMVGWINKNFDEFQFYLGESNEMENAMIILAYYKNPEDMAPHFVYFADGLRAQTF
eukprot:CAMPEP_0176432782 /NCGR_PEP_ID=MMETSP0127-20121128/15590_1 /TAXON_ID=938130 /ORGANISM="Platyophrya macrostoma, Strain WH" /LENGTH=173 /DNA_ID=CAMNT_0017815001 /DNA_START=17 /DNA_END=538 /DNA_ORIENTATION=-